MPSGLLAAFCCVMSGSHTSAHSQSTPRFDRRFFDSKIDFTCIGTGEMGGKAVGLAEADALLKSGRFGDDFPAMVVNIPRLTVITTEVFDAFLERNDLESHAESDVRDDLIAEAFQRAAFPPEFVGDLGALVAGVHQPLAIRSSSLMEDALSHPFAGVYETKMIPNNQPDPETRFHKLMEAVKFVYASTYFAEAKAYRKAIGCRAEHEKMAVIIQEVVGQRCNDRFYPNVSGVARSYTYYPFGNARPEQGVVALALGLGKTIVDGGSCWSYSPALPHAGPPFASARDMLKLTQSRFWAVNMGKPSAYDPIHETEYLLSCSLADAEADDVLNNLASTYQIESDQLYPGISVPGPRVLNFAPILNLETVPLNALIGVLLRECEDRMGTGVEIEFAVTLPKDGTTGARFGLLQVRPAETPKEHVHVDWENMEVSRILLASDQIMGNGEERQVQDIVYVKPEAFDASQTRAIATEIGSINARLVEDQIPYLLIGFGRWGSSDPWLGIPVVWSQVSGARAMVEATLPSLNVERSQGSHFFHNLSSFQVCFFSVRYDGPWAIQWEWLNQQTAVRETSHLRHVRLEVPLNILVDGRCGKGVIYHD